MAQSIFPEQPAGISSGSTASRPSNPSIGTQYYNGTLGRLEIYTDAGWKAAGGIPYTPTIGAPANVGTSRPYNDAAATVAFTPATAGGLVTEYVATSTPGSLTGTGSTSPVTVTGLSSSTQYTFKVTAKNDYGVAADTTASSAVTVTSVPQAPTIGAVTVGNLSASVAFTANATGGSTITGYTVTSTPEGLTGTGSSSPITVSGLTNGVSYTFKVKATNANGTGLESAASASILAQAVASSVEVLLVGGGAGGGGTNRYGGGGAGGVQYTASRSVSQGTTLTFAIGAAGNTDSAGGTTTMTGLTSATGGNSASGTYRGGTSGNGFTAPTSNMGGTGGGGSAGNGGGAGGAGSGGGGGAASSYFGTSYAGGGGGGGIWNNGNFQGDGGSGGGTYGVGGRGYSMGNAGGGNPSPNGGYAGSQGVVVIRYPNTFADIASSNATYTRTTPTGYKMYEFTTSGTVTF